MIQGYIENTQVEVDKFENELFLQAEIDYWDGVKNISSVNAELSVYEGEAYQYLGSFNLFDDGEKWQQLSINTSLGD